MKKLLLLIFMSVWFSQITLCDEPAISSGLIPLTCSYNNPTAIKGNIKRSPAKRPVAYLSGETVSFPAFACDCTFELVDAVTDEVIYSLYVLASETSCPLPSGMKGEYILRFTFEQYTLEGYVEL